LGDHIKHLNYFKINVFVLSLFCRTKESAKLGETNLRKSTYGLLPDRHQWRKLYPAGIPRDKLINYLMDHCSNFYQNFKAKPRNFKLCNLQKSVFNSISVRLLSAIRSEVEFCEIENNFLYVQILRN
jgi:hypothetical protein